MIHVKKFAFASLIVLSITACGGSSGSYIDDVENPYSEGTGHYAGYEWAERTGGRCNGNSRSFNEGCEEYYLQIER